MKIFSEDVILLKELQTCNKMDIYYLHQKYKLSPAQVARSIVKFGKNNILTLKEDVISITDYGTKWLIANRDFLYLEKRNYAWKQPIGLIKNPLIINAPFSPKRKSLDIKIYKLLEGEK